MKKRLNKELNSLVGGLEKMLDDSVRDLKANIKQVRGSLRALKITDIGNATYVVTLNSCWASDGEKCTTTQYKGSLADAIKTAEIEFQTVNSRIDIQAHYVVNIKLADTRLLHFLISQNDLKPKI